VRLHTFGLNIRFLQHEEIRSLVSSSDTDAWVVSYSKYGRMKIAGSRGRMIEVDLKDVTKRFMKINVDPVTIYFNSLLAFVNRLKSLGLL